MYASLIRQSRYGEPKDAFEIEVVDTPEISSHQVLVMVMAAGINFNNAWAAMGTPVDVIAARQKHGAKEDFHIGGSDASGVVWAVGDAVTHVKVGDHVVLSCATWDRYAEDVLAGGDPLASTSLRIWGYETNHGSFAQFTAVEDFQCFPKPSHLTWEEASSYMLVGATAYRQLMCWAPHTVQPGDPVLIWGGAGGLGTMAIQITKEFGGRPIAVVSDEERAEHCMRLGATGVINRSDFDHWGRLPDLNDDAASLPWLRGVRAFGKKFWEVLGERRNPKIVFEQVGQATIPTSVYVCDTAGMIVICGGTAGYNGDVDLRYLWMRQKRLQGSHFATTEQCAKLNQLVIDGRVNPGMASVGKFEDLGEFHQQMYENTHPPGNMAVLVNAPSAGHTGFSA
jgi:crotonyl-CoA carboxylase/reductase